MKQNAVGKGNQQQGKQKKQKTTAGHIGKGGAKNLKEETRNKGGRAMR